MELYFQDKKMLFQFIFLIPFLIAGDPRTIKYNPKSTLKKFDYKWGPMAMFDRMVRLLAMLVIAYGSLF